MILTTWCESPGILDDKKKGGRSKKQEYLFNQSVFQTLTFTYHTAFKVLLDLRFLLMQQKPHLARQPPALPYLLRGWFAILD